MTKIYFYHNARDKLAAACSFLGKAYSQGKTFAVYAPDQEVAQTLDRLLWTQIPLGFIPHCFSDSPLADQTPILIANRAETLPAGQQLLNLGEEVPPDFSRFEHLIEIVGQEEDDKLQARRRFKYYKEMGLDIQSIALNHE